MAISAYPITQTTSRRISTAKPLEGGIYIDVRAYTYIGVYIGEYIYYMFKEGPPRAVYSMPSTKWPVSKPN